jgi:hypothetical protein
VIEPLTMGNNRLRANANREEKRKLTDAAREELAAQETVTKSRGRLAAPGDSARTVIAAVAGNEQV